MRTSSGVSRAKFHPMPLKRPADPEGGLQELKQPAKFRPMLLKRPADPEGGLQELLVIPVRKC